MPNFKILYDEPQEAFWFRSLNDEFADIPEGTITNAQGSPTLESVLSYDRPDIVLLDDGQPVLVIEETVEVPSGHNVGQRFARIAAAAESSVPSLYFGPYVAKKHGGATAGPRYMNLRLFHSLDAMTRVTGAAVTTICWPVDDACEVRRDSEKDSDVKNYISTFLENYHRTGMPGINTALLQSSIHRRMLEERQQFVDTQVRNPEQYDSPPNSVTICSAQDFASIWGVDSGSLPGRPNEVVVYNVGMKYIRSDPYTGMAMLYHYLYIAENPGRILVLWFPNISRVQWRTAAGNGTRKDIRLFRHAAEAILFSDGFLKKDEL